MEVRVWLAAEDVVLEVPDGLTHEDLQEAVYEWISENLDYDFEVIG